MQNVYIFNYVRQYEAWCRKQGVSNELFGGWNFYSSEWKEFMVTQKQLNLLISRYRKKTLK